MWPGDIKRKPILEVLFYRNVLTEEARASQAMAGLEPGEEVIEIE